MNISMNHPMPAAVTRSAASMPSERTEVAENDRDSDDDSAKAAAPKPSLSVNGQALGQLLNEVA